MTESKFQKAKVSGKNKISLKWKGGQNCEYQKLNSDVLGVE
jgi:hypothetical protein